MIYGKNTILQTHTKQIHLVRGDLSESYLALKSLPSLAFVNPFEDTSDF